MRNDKRRLDDVGCICSIALRIGVTGMISRQFLERVKLRLIGVIIFAILCGFKIIDYQVKQYREAKGMNDLLEQKYNITLTDLSVVAKKLQEGDIKYEEAQKIIEQQKADDYDHRIVSANSQHWIEEVFRKDKEYKTEEWRLYIWKLCKKYAYLSERPAPSGQDYLAKWMYAVCSSETCFVPDAVYRRNKDGYPDYGITSIHQPVSLQDHANFNKMLGKVFLHEPDLMNKDWKTSPSLNIAVRFVMRDFMIDTGQDWTAMDEKRGTDFLWKLKQVK
jgi:predicted aspartyl protease